MITASRKEIDVLILTDLIVSLITLHSHRNGNYVEEKGQGEEIREFYVTPFQFYYVVRFIWWRSADEGAYGEWEKVRDRVENR